MLVYVVMLIVIVIVIVIGIVLVVMILIVMVPVIVIVIELVIGQPYVAPGAGGRQPDAKGPAGARGPLERAQTILY